jgi:hypothetical protein
MGRGGYRWNAGRPAFHVKAEQCLRIDARRWAREGLFTAGRAGAWVWRDADTGEETGRIGYCGEGGAVALSFTVNGDPVRQHIATQQTACNYGGSRLWFSCPRCWRRVAVLFLRGPAGFVCRHCGRVAYGSQSDDDMGRAWRKQRKAEAKLVDGWRRPKGMHRATRKRLIAIIVACEERRDAALAAFMAKRFPDGWR